MPNPFTPLIAPALCSEKKDKKSAQYGDRFIPNREAMAFDTIDLTREPQKLQQTPQEMRVYLGLFGTTPAEYRSQKLLSFNAVKKTNQVSYDPFFQRTTSCSLPLPPKPQKAELRATRVLDAPGIPSNFYYNLLFWSKSDRILLPVETDFPNTFQIASALAGENLKDRQLVLFDAVDKAPCSIVALGMEDVLSGWSDGYVRSYRTGQLTAAYQEINVGVSTAINAIAVTGPQTCIVGTMHGDMVCIDLRSQTSVYATNVNDTAGATQCIAGMAFNGDYYLATGANDNRVKLWDIRRIGPHAFYTYTTHTAGVKALAFQPDSSTYLATGGGTACRKLCVWNVLTGETTLSVDTGSQITGLHWFKHEPRYLLTSHGYTQGGIKLWHKTKKALVLESEVALKTETDGRALYLAGSETNNQVAVVSESQRLSFFNTVGLKKPVTNKPGTVGPVMLSGSFTIR